MSNHTEWGHASAALYTLRKANPADLHYQPDEPAHTLGLFTAGGDGLALQGTRREILDYLQLGHPVRSNAKPIHAPSSTKPSNDSTRYDKNAPPPSTTPTTAPATSLASTSKKSTFSTMSPKPPNTSTTSSLPTNNHHRTKRGDPQGPARPHDRSTSTQRRFP